jgi:hypothetical protein
MIPQQNLPDQVDARIEWLNSVRDALIETIALAEASDRFLNVTGEEHMRDATENWLQQQHAFLAKLSRRLQIEAARRR